MSQNYNRLVHEKSPYLLQHKDNPVHWYGWGNEAFEASRKENKPIFLSVGYSTCHWCHVMAHQSFEDAEVAQVLNQNFISIKVDREERPDVDDIYMSAVHAMGERGGWPLSMFLTPDLKPFFGGTYWPKENFLNILRHLAKVWKEEPERVRESSDSLVDHLRRQKEQFVTEEVSLSKGVFHDFYEQTLSQFDPVWGGVGRAPKFPHSQQLSMLLRIYHQTKEPQALQMVRLTLEKMARGGIYDHLGFGFSRYSTDEKWLVPHFEKMLYDNALLVVTYLEAYQVTQEEMFRTVAQETLDYLLRVMTHPDGGFYSAEDADSEGEEGKFYVWRLGELREILNSDELDSVMQVLQVTPEGNFEHGTNIFSLSENYSWAEKKSPQLQSAMQKLFQVREKRIHPHKDDKILTAWNGLAIRAMALGYQIIGEKKYLEAAHRAASFLQNNLFKDRQLLARYRDGEGRFVARLEDYAYLIQGLIDLYQSDFKPEILKWAVELQEIQNKKFWDNQSGSYYFTDGSDSSLLLRTREGMDGALPNANAVSALNLLRLYDFTFEENFKEKGSAIIQAYAGLISQYPTAFGQMLIAFDYLQGSKEVGILNHPQDHLAGNFLKSLRNQFIPNLVVAASSAATNFPAVLNGKVSLDGKTTFYVCENQTCQKPTHDSDEIIRSVVFPPN